MNVISLRFLSASCPSKALYDDGAFKTKKLVMVVVVRISISAIAGRVMAPTGCITCLEKPFSGIGEGFSLAASMPTFVKASQNDVC